jgi:hypothetical protein
MTRHVYRLAMASFTLGLLFLLTGCSELVHEGQISDRESAFTVGDVRIEQQAEDGGWRLLGKTDGRGRWWILKDRIKGGGMIRISKAGYYPIRQSENEFLQSINLLMIPSGSAGSGDDLGGGPGGGLPFVPEP